MKHIVKRRGHSEEYDQRKLYASVYSSCISVRVPVGEAELVAENVCKEVDSWLGKKTEVTSGDVRRVAAKGLDKYNPDAAFIYSFHERFHH